MLFFDFVNDIKKYVSAHLHLDVVYLLEADDNQPLIFKEDESSGIKWIPFEEADDKSMCDFIRPIHKKLIKKLKQSKKYIKCKGV